MRGLGGSPAAAVEEDGGELGLSRGQLVPGGASPVGRDGREPCPGRPGAFSGASEGEAAWNPLPGTRVPLVFIECDRNKAKLEVEEILTLR